MRHTSWVGVDFGTTNSAVAFVDASGSPRLARFPTAHGPRPTFPSVRRMFVERFGEDKVTGGEELTSVATGLALRAREQWPADRDPAETP